MRKIDKYGKMACVDSILKRLRESGAYGCVTTQGGFEVFVPRNHFARPVQSVGPEVLAELQSGELIAPLLDRRQAWGVSQLGRARLRRAEAADSPYRSQHQALAMRETPGDDGTATVVRINHAESPLAWLASHKDRKGNPLISPEQFAAGERMRRDFTLANLPPRVTAMWGMPIHHPGRSSSSDSANMNDTMMDAKDRLWAAFDAVGPDLGGILLQICCHLHGLAHAEKQLGWPARAGKVVLGIALDRLAAHYGINLAAGMPKNQLEARRWGVERENNKINLRNTQKSSCKS